MSHWAIGGLIFLVLAIVIGNILLVKKSAKFGLKNKDGTMASSQDPAKKRQDHNANWDADLDD